MNLEDVVVGDLYTVDLKTAPGTWQVTAICKPDGKKPYVDAVKYDSKADERSRSIAKRRSFDPAKLTPKSNGKAKESNASKVVSKEVKVLETFGDVQLILEDVTYWPNHKRRGRPRKVAA